MDRKPLYLSTENKNIIWFDRLLAVGILLFIVGLPFHLVIKDLIPGPIGTYWKEILLGLLIGIWAVRSILTRSLNITRSSLLLVAFIYAVLIVLRFLTDGATIVAGWGLYISILYLPLVFLIPVALDRYPKAITPLLGILVTLGGIIAAGGILEYILNRPLWPSAELITRQGFADVYIYGTHLRRVYFVFDSPTTLANTLALLLPLALVLVFLTRRLAVRIAAGFAAGLIFTCILLTFSRGIWVAIALAGIASVFIKFFLAGNKKFFLAGIATIVIGVLIFLIVLLVRPLTTPVSTAYTIELDSDRYEKVPSKGTPVNLNTISPQTGPVEFQDWTLYDAIRQKNDTRKVLYSSPKNDGTSNVIYRATIPDSGSLKFSIALNPDVWTPEKGDGVNFKIFIFDVASPQNGELVFQRYINPKSNPSDRRWRNYIVDLSKWSGKSVDLYLITEPGPQKNAEFDWAGWGEIQLTSVPKNYIAENMLPPSNLVIDHLASVFDWTSDETNRDRLLAWNLALQAWKQSPIWGNGLGTSGVAGLRTMPDTAFVTESQPLKAIVELGIPGILLWACLWFVMMRTALNLYRKEVEPNRKNLILGIFSSLVIIFGEGLVYQNLEVKQVNAFFWTLVGMLIFFQGSVFSSTEGK